MAIGATTFPAHISPSIVYAASPLGFVEPGSPLSYQDCKADHYNTQRKGVKSTTKIKSLSERRATGQVVTPAPMSAKTLKTDVNGVASLRGPSHKVSSSSLSSASSSSAAAATASGSNAPKRHKLSRRLLDNRAEKPQMKTIIERRNSTQSLKLDLDGLDLGQDGTVSGQFESIAETTKQSPNLNRARTNTFGASTSPSIPAQEERQDASKSKNGKGEDSFLAHLRKCQDSNDDYDANIAKSIDAFGKKERLLRIMAGETSTAPLLSARSITFDGNGESSPSTCSTMSSDLAPLVAVARSPWTTLIPISTDPISTLDIPSIEEMGLHSIDVGSSEDWEGFTLTYPSEICQEIEVSQRSTQWSIARSKKRQRKWIITPTRLAPSRTVVVSDHVNASKAKDDADATPGEASPSPFANGGRYSLRFLQTGAGAPSVTILLASPASHRLQASRLSIKDDEGASTPNGERTRSVVPTSVLDEHITTTISTDSTPDEASTNDQSGQWPAMRASAARRDSRRGLNHHRSSSTIHATIAPMVNLESRRPSLGKSISHESIFRELNMEASDAIKEEDATFQAITLAQINDEMETLDSPVTAGKSPFAPTSFSTYSMGSVPIARQDTISPPRSFDSRNQPFPTMVDPYDTLELPPASMMDSTTSRNGMDIRSKVVTPTRLENGWHGDSVSSPTTASSSKSTPKKDRKLSGWIRKKVGVNSGSSGHQPPLPPAWQQTGRLSPLGGSLIVSSRDAHSSRSSRKHARSNQTASSASGRSSGYDGSRSGGSDYYMNDYAGSSRGYDSTTSTMTSATASPLSSIFSVNPEEMFTSASRNTLMNMASRPLAQVYSSQGEYVWPGVMSARGERRRSNSDDNMALMMEAARRRHEALTRGDDGPLASGAASAAITIPARRLDYPVSPAARDLNETDVTAAFSSSLPAHSVLNSFNAFARRRSTAPRTPSVLLDLDSVPSDALTMIIPLPLSMSGKRSAARYLRVSFVPFGQEDGLSTGKEGVDSTTGHTHASSTWYKKIAHAWHPTNASSATTARIESQHGTSDEEEGVVAAGAYSSPFPTLTIEQGGNGNANKLESFKIIAKVLSQPQHHYRGVGNEGHANRSKESSTEGLPEPFPFPFILGVCDRKKSVDLIAEGWQSIGLPIEPTEDGPMNRVADLIMAGCVACMDL